MFHTGFHMFGVHLLPDLGVHVFQEGFDLGGYLFSFGGEVYQFITAVVAIFLPYNPSFLLEIIDQVGEACFVFRCFFGQRLLADSLFFPLTMHYLKHFKGHIDVVAFQYSLNGLAECHACP